jgi:hypothetical protein
MLRFSSINLNLNKFYGKLTQLMSFGVINMQVTLDIPEQFAWLGSDFKRGESQDEYHQLCFRKDYTLIDILVKGNPLWLPY